VKKTGCASVKCGKRPNRAGKYNLKALMYKVLRIFVGKKVQIMSAFKTKKLGPWTDTSQKDTGTIIPPIFEDLPILPTLPTLPTLP